MLLIRLSKRGWIQISFQRIQNVHSIIPVESTMLERLKEKIFLKYIKDFDPFYSTMKFVVETNLLPFDSVDNLANYRVSKRKFKLLLLSFSLQIITIIRFFVMAMYPTPEIYYFIVGLYNGLKNLRPWILVSDNFLILGILFRK